MEEGGEKSLPSYFRGDRILSLIDAIKNYKPVNENENQALKWWTFQEALKASTEPWMVERVYKKLIEKTEVVEG